MRVLALFMAGSLCACASSGATRSLSQKVGTELTEVFPEDGRRWSYEAENEVIIALDRLDAARDDKIECEARQALAETAMETVDQRGGKAKEVWEARQTQVKAEIDAANSAIEVAELGVYCARTSLELTKARLAVRFDLPVEEDFVKRFEGQYEDCARDLEEAKTDLEKQQTTAFKAKDDWRKVRGSYVSKTGDHDHGLWID